MKRFMVLLLLLSIFCSFLVAGCAQKPMSLISPETRAPSATTTPPASSLPPGTTVPPASTSVPVENADVFDETDLFAVMEEAEDLLLEGSYIIENPSEYVQYFFNSNQQILVNCFETTEDAIIISYSTDKSDRQTVLQYGIFLHLICSRYPDAVCKADYEYIPGKTNRPFSAYVFSTPDIRRMDLKPLWMSASILMKPSKTARIMPFISTWGTPLEFYNAERTMEPLSTTMTLNTTKNT